MTIISHVVRRKVGNQCDTGNGDKSRQDDEIVGMIVIVELML